MSATERARASRWPWFGFGGFLILASFGLVLVEANGEPLAQQLLFVVTFGLFGGVGALIASRVPGNRIGALLLLVSGVTALSFVAGEFATYQAQRGSAGVVARWGALFGEIGWLLGLLPGLMLLLLWFPDGRLPSPRWRWLPWSLAVVLAWGVIAVLGEPMFSDLELANPLFVPAVEPVAGTFEAGFFAFVGLLAAAVVSLIFRFRHASGAERQQIKWVAFSAGVMFIGLVLAQVLTGVISDNATDVIVALSLATLPISVGVAVMRYRLWDLDVVVRKTVLVGLVLVLLLAVFGFLTLVVQATVSIVADDVVSGGTGEYLLALLVGILVWPIYRLSRRWADRIVYGRRAAPYEILGGFADRVATTYASEDLLQRMATAVGEGVLAERADVVLELGTGRRVSATWPAVDAPGDPVAADDDRSAMFPIAFRGDRLGQLGVRKAPGDRVSASDHKLLVQLATQAGPVLHNVALTEELKARLDDLHAAQRRLVTAQDVERRRLERNIHDGAQQQLVALAVKLKLADGLIERDPAKAHEMLAGLQGDTQMTLEDLRDLARGIYPPLLADQGLAAALEAQARRSPVPVSVDASVDLGRFAPEVEAAVYFSCLEGLQNVAKYANASAVSVSIERANGHVSFAIRDDGRGFDRTTTTMGMGLQGMADRVAALAGELEITSAVGTGTTIEGRIPLEAS